MSETKLATHKNERYSYELYTREEIERTWRMSKSAHIQNIKDGKKYVLCHARDKEEAIVLAALIVRKADIKPSCVQYLEDYNKVVVNCEYLGVDFEEVQEACRFVTERYSGFTGLKKLRFDLRGDPLFKNPHEDTDSFYKGRGFPTGGASICPLPETGWDTIKRLHEHLPGGLTGMI